MKHLGFVNNNLHRIARDNLWCYSDTMPDVTWNPWHGCHKLSPGCQNCYVYRTDAAHDKDASVVAKTASFDLPRRRGRGGGLKIPSGTTVYTCFTSDFFLEDADAWRPDAWAMMRERPDLDFMFITKRIDRMASCVPADWGEGYGNVAIGCTCENQQMADYRLPIFRDAPIRTKYMICEPLLGEIDLTEHLGSWVAGVIVGGESGNEARPCDYEWVLGIRAQCAAAGVSFRFKQTGAKLIKDGKLYRIERRFQHAQARKAGIDTPPCREKET